MEIWFIFQFCYIEMSFGDISIVKFWNFHEIYKMFFDGLVAWLHRYIVEL